MKKGKVLFLIPARGGSKRLPMKNLRRIGPYSLVEWALRDTVATIETSECIEESKIVVSSEDRRIMAACRYGPMTEDRLRASNSELIFHERPIELAADDTRTEELFVPVLRTLGDWHPNVIVLMQPTSPMREHWWVEMCIEAVLNGRSSARTVWELSGKLINSGAVYAMSFPTAAAGDLLGATPFAIEIPDDQLVNIDTDEDLDFARDHFDRFWRD